MQVKRYKKSQLLELERGEKLVLVFVACSNTQIHGKNNNNWNGTLGFAFLNILIKEESYKIIY